MAHINIPPTRSNLLQMKKELQFAREGYEILDRKRVVLTSELIRVAHEAGVLQEEVWKLLAKAYRALEQAKLTMGQEHVAWAALAMSRTIENTLDVGWRLLSMLPKEELTRVSPDEIRQYYKESHGSH